MPKNIHPSTNNNNSNHNNNNVQQHQALLGRLVYSWRVSVLLVLLLVTTAWSAVQIWGERRLVLPGTPQPKEEPQTEQQPQQHDDTTIITTNNNNNNNHVSVATAAAAREFLWSRRRAYAAHDRQSTWNLRGLGYLYATKQIVLAAQWLVDPTITYNDTATTTTTTTTDTTGARSVSAHVIIENVYSSDGDEYENGTTTRMRQQQRRRRTDCHLLTIWVRVNGPEIFAGTAQAVQPDDADATQKSCFWKFTMDLQVPGTYHVDAKVLLWNGNATTQMNATTMNQCEVRSGSPDNVTLAAYPRHGGFQGFKLYTPAASCCEICSRQPECRYWATPPLDLPEPSFFINGCELFYDANVTDDAVPKSMRIPDLIQYGVPLLRSRRQRQHRTTRRLSEEDELFEHGPPHSNPTAYFLGCGWSYHFTLDFPCLSGDLDDRVYLSQSNFTFSGMSTTKSFADSVSSSVNRSHVSLPLCQLATRVTNQRGRWVRKTWPNEAICPSPMEPDVNITRLPAQKFDGAFPHCWHRDDLYTAKQYCFEQNCRFIPPESLWYSSLQEERNWFGIWKYYDCDLVEFTDTDLQECIHKRNIAPFEVRGTSIAKNLRQYTNQRSRNLTFFDPTKSGARKVIIDTVSSPHLVWKHDHQEWMATLDAMMPVTNDTDYYIINPFYWSSEREPHVHAASADKLAQWMETILRPKGYKVIDALELTKAFTYDTATQMDGVHIIGPPMKMMVTIILHDLCAGVVNGTRL